jgi:hypothetical protein
MWHRLYRDHIIMAFPSFDTARNGWAPQANISWCVGSGRDFKFVRFPIRFTTESEAVAYSLKRGQAWIDTRLKQSSSIAPRLNPPVVGVIAPSRQRRRITRKSN